MTTSDVCRETGATYRQVTYWASRGWIPGQEARIGTGTGRRWTIEQLERVRALRRAAELRRLEICVLAETLERAEIFARPLVQADAI